jgi:hypothetical protein
MKENGLRVPIGKEGTNTSFAKRIAVAELDA